MTKTWKASEGTPSRFWAKVQKTSGCWEWTAAVFKTTGYGQFVYQVSPGVRKVDTAHRVSWALTHGPILDGLFVLHRCDNRKCVRPSHLFLGTAKDNSADMVRKGRGATPIQRGGRRKIPLGAVQSIRDRAMAGDLLKDIARDFGVDPSNISRLVRGESYFYCRAHR